MPHGLQLLRGEVATGGWQATCRCGWAGAWLTTQREAKAAYAVHKADEALRAALRAGTVVRSEAGERRAPFIEAVGEAHR